jgi:threonine synthase
LLPEVLLQPARLEVPLRWASVYREAMALGGSVEPITLGEGFTPIVSKEIGGVPARFKLEYLMPTGSFKDRGASVVISQLAASGTTRAYEDSSGNAGIAMAAYAAHAGISMDVLVPEDAPPAKLFAIEAHGGRLIRIAGGRGAVAAEAIRRAASGGAYASHVWSPYFIEGTKTFSFEIWEQTERIPPRIFMPVGNGTLLLGAFNGFAQLREWGLIQAVPRLMGVQTVAFSPFLDRDETAAPPRATIADGIRIASPPRERRVREAISRSDGGFLAVDDGEITDARDALGMAGLDVEPTSAVALAGARRWLASDPDAEREIQTAGAPLIALTGTGLKTR